LEVVATDRHEATQALKRKLRRVEASFHFKLTVLQFSQTPLKCWSFTFDFHRQFSRNLNKLLGVRHEDIWPRGTGKYQQ
jgi:hypothetical protein